MLCVSGSLWRFLLLRLPDSLDKEDRLLYFQTSNMAECLAGPGYNAERLSIPYVPQVTGTTEPVPELYRLFGLRDIFTFYSLCTLELREQMVL